MDYIYRLPTGGHYIRNLELVAGDLLEFVYGEHTVFGRIEHDGLRLTVVCSGGHQKIPLNEIVQARYIGRGTSRDTK
jgi:hypothetical protein